jgi:hypothetical protein
MVSGGQFNCLIKIVKIALDILYFISHNSEASIHEGQGTTLFGLLSLWGGVRHKLVLLIKVLRLKKKNTKIVSRSQVAVLIDRVIDFNN